MTERPPRRDERDCILRSQRQALIGEQSLVLPYDAFDLYDAFHCQFFIIDSINEYINITCARGFSVRVASDLFIM